MKELAVLVAVLCAAVSVGEAQGHKPISSDGTNTSFENPLEIPDHRLSWAIYEQMDPYQTRFYRFDAKEGDPFYASIAIPKLERLEGFTPGLALISEGIETTMIHGMSSELPPGGVVAYSYGGALPSTEFFEPFTQTTYWERQKVQISIPADGAYYIAVFDSQGVFGKYSLAVGTIEDFSMLDFFTVLPAAWFQTKYFFEDYASLLAPSVLVSMIPALIILQKARSGRKKKADG